jgi:hypothetical protein
MRLWNILVPYPGETGTYLGVSARNIPQIVQRESSILSNLVGIESRAENPRVGGSIPPLATTKSAIWTHRATVDYGIKP